MQQLQASPSNKKISELYKRIHDSSLILQPEFQRKFVWNREHKEKFIDTILRGLPFPEIYFAQSGIDIEKISTREIVVDGQQRLGTIIQYIDEPENSKEFGKLVSKFKDLQPDDKKDFLNYNVVIRDLGDINPDQIRDIFKRINQTKYALEQIEIHNAVYDGEFITTAKNILAKIENSHLPTLSESELNRMEDLHFVLLLMTTVENKGYFNRDKDIETFIVTFNDVYAHAMEIEANFVNNFEFIKSLELPVDTIWYRKSNFFTLFTELYFHRYIHIMEIPLNIKERIRTFEANVMSHRDINDKSNDYSLYYGYMYVGTNNRQSRVERGRLFKTYILN